MIETLRQRLASKDTPNQPLSEATRNTNRERIIDAVEKIWITGFLNNVMNEMESLRLDLRFAEPDKVLQRPGLEDYRLPDNSAILRIFNDLNRRLIILGDPGAGKTVLLLQLCRDLIAEARRDPKKPIPIVLALSSWAIERLPFEEWLCKEIRDKYGFNRRIADDLVKGEQLLYLLDGLDEVAENAREACLEEIKLFVKDRPVDFVLCSRRAEFTVLTTDLDIPGTLLIQALTLEQVGDYLADDEFAGLRTIMAENLIVRNFARIPFMLNTMAVVTRRISERNIRMGIKQYLDPMRLRDYFLEAYLNLRLHEKLHPHYNNHKLIRARLKWLSSQLIRHDQTDFYIENLQPTWFATNQEITRYLHYVRLFFAVIFGSIIGTTFAVVRGIDAFSIYGGFREAFVIGLFHGFHFGAGFGLALWFMLGLSDRQSHRFNLIITVILFTLASAFGLSFIVGFAFGHFEGLAFLRLYTNQLLQSFGLEDALGYGPAVAIAASVTIGFGIKAEIVPAERLDWLFSRRTFLFGITVGLIVAIVTSSIILPLSVLGFDLSLGNQVRAIFALTFAIVFSLAYGLTYSLNFHQTLETRTTPNQAIRSSLSNFWRVWIFASAPIVLYVAIWITLESQQLFDWLAGCLASGLAFGLVTGRKYGGEAVIKHVVLRILLAREGHVPLWRYDRFLDYCAERVILRKVGGGYRFVHDYLRQYLASAAFVPENVPRSLENDL
jgi:MFS family permease